MLTMTSVRHRLLAAAAALTAVALMTVSAKAEPTKITFLHTNDIYEISPKDGVGGLAELMTLLRAERAKSAHSITTFGGDLISPSVMSGLTKGKQMIDLMNALGVSVAVPGNHEFDFGPEVTAQRIAESTFPWLGANVLGRNGKPAVGLKETLTMKVGDITVGFFGVLTPDTDVRSSPGKDIEFADVMEAADKAVRQLKAAGADIVVALTHLEIDQDRELAESVGGIDLILGGHDHDPITFYEGGVLIHKSGYDAHYLGAIDLTVERKKQGGKTLVNVLPTWRMISTAGVAPDPEVKKLVDRYNAALDSELAAVIGKAGVVLNLREIDLRTGETNFGDLVAEAMRAAVGADVGLVNGGAIRGDRTYDAGASLTRKDILAALPFSNVTVLLELTGADLLAALENGVSKVEERAGRFPQIAGMTFVYDPAAPAGNRIVEVTVGGEPLEEDKIYRVATNEYVAGGGDGYETMKNGDALIDASAGTLVATSLMNYIAAKKTVAFQVDGRIRKK